MSAKTRHRRKSETAPEWGMETDSETPTIVASLEEFDPILESFLDVQNMLRRACWRMIRTYGEVYGTFDDLMGHAFLSFMKAYQLYNPEKSVAFPTFVYHKTYWGFKDLMRDYHKSINGNDRPIFWKNDIPDYADRFGMDRLLSHLSEDAKRIVKIYMGNAPRALLNMMADCETHWEQRGVVRSYLHGTGWNTQRITDAFREIQNLKD